MCACMRVFLQVSMCEIFVTTGASRTNECLEKRVRGGQAGMKKTHKLSLNLYACCR